MLKPVWDIRLGDRWYDQKTTPRSRIFVVPANTAVWSYIPGWNWFLQNGEEQRGNPLYWVQGGAVKWLEV